MDDKIIRRARELGIGRQTSLADTSALYLDDMRALRNDSVDVHTRPSDYIVHVVSGPTKASLPPEPLRDRA